MNNKLLLITISTVFVLAGCGGGGGNNQANQSSVEVLSDAPAASDAGALDDINTLKSDLADIFGGADAEPIPVEDNDTVQDVIDRGRS